MERYGISLHQRFWTPALAMDRHPRVTCRFVPGIGQCDLAATADVFGRCADLDLEFARFSGPSLTGGIEPRQGTHVEIYHDSL